jgi:1-acyl-sn-glycerol-3-phosphate acyltransferase
MVYFIGKWLLFLLFKICFRLNIVGAENCPRRGPLIVAPNHASFFDPIIAGISVSRELNFLARDSLFKNRIFGKILSSVNTFPLKREGADLGAVKLAIDKLSQGKAVLIFPEGTRSKDGKLGTSKPGIGLLAASSGASILPCYIKGSNEALPRGTIFPRFKKISVYIGRPLQFNINVSGRESYIRVASEVMKAISELKTNSKAT